MSPRRFFLRLLSCFRSGRAEAELSREINSHLQLLEDEYVARGMTPREARSAARRTFGGVEQAKEHQRDARSFRWLAGWQMDLKLGTRMLVKTPGLTIIGVAALAVAIGAGAAYMEFLNDMFHPALPLPQGNRVVAVLSWDVAKANPEHRALHDFSVWRKDVRSIEHLGAFVLLQRNLITEDGRGEPVDGVEISASAFAVAPTPPLLGRPLHQSDEAPGAPAVAVIGEQLWKSRFGSDPQVIGRSIRLGAAHHTIVGVMPAAFGFPVRQILWVPLRLDESSLRRGEGPAARVFGRLAPGAHLETAQAELDAIGSRMAAAPGGTDRELRPRVLKYVDAMWASTDGRLQYMILYAVNVFFLGLLALCGANVATLVFARTAARQGEITVRTALGASRGRIVSQLFAESLVLATLAAAVGLMGARFGVAWIKNTFLAAQQMTSLPFWWNDALSPTTLLYAAALAFAAAAITGVVPALKATGPRMQGRLKEAAAGGSTARFGRMWTAVIVGQVAVTVVFLTILVAMAASLSSSVGATRRLAFTAREFLSLTLVADREQRAGAPAGGDESAHRDRVNATFRELKERLTADPAVAGVTYADAYPAQGNEYIFEVEGMPDLRTTDDPMWARIAGIDPEFFSTLNVPIVSGRAFTGADAGQQVAIVDQTFVRLVLGGRDPVGLRIRETDRSDAGTGPWYQIVGVVSDLSDWPNKEPNNAVIYRPVAPAAAAPLRVLVRGKGDAAAIAPAVRKAAADTDPALRLYEIMTLDRIGDADREANRFFLVVAAVLGAVTLMLATAGIYALMSFTLARRRREIGIRAALGAGPRRIVTSVFGRAFAHVGLGVLLGSIPGGTLLAVGIAEAGGGNPWLMVFGTIGSALFVIVVSLLACLAPTRRALRVAPTEALRSDG